VRVDGSGTARRDHVLQSPVLVHVPPLPRPKAYRFDPMQKHILHGAPFRPTMTRPGTPHPGAEETAMLGGCLFLTVVFAAALTFELQHVPALGRTHTWVVSTVLAVLATLAVGCVHGVVVALRRRMAPETDPSGWQDGATVRLSGTIRPHGEALRTPFGHLDAVAMEYRARTTEHHNDVRQGSPGWRGRASVASLLDTGSMRLALSGTPTLRHFPEVQHAGEAALCDAARHLANTVWQIAPDLTDVDLHAVAALRDHGADALPAHLVDRRAADALQMDASDPTPEHYLARLRERPWMFAERAIPVGCTVTVTGTWRALPPRIEVGYGPRTAEHAIQPGEAVRVASSELTHTLVISAAIAACAAGAHYVVLADGGALYHALRTVLGSTD